jgi:hypothetical protein
LTSIFRRPRAERLQVITSYSWYLSTILARIPTSQIPDPVPVRILERARVDLVHDRRLPPLESRRFRFHPQQRFPQGGVERHDPHDHPEKHDEEDFPSRAVLGGWPFRPRLGPIVRLGSLVELNFPLPTRHTDVLERESGSTFDALE